MGIASENLDVVMTELSNVYTFTKGSIKEPDEYLGAQVGKFHIEDSENPDKVRWAFSSDKYMTNAIKTVANSLPEAGLTF